jgi:hypothetical protein
MREPSGRIVVSSGHLIGIHGDAVIAVDRAAINKQISAAVGPDMAESYGLERLALLTGH